MENITDFLEKAAFILVFCLAGTLLFNENKVLNERITYIKTDITKQETVYMQPLQNIPNEKVTYQELIGTLMGNLDYDIQINQMTIDNDLFNYQDFDLSSIPKNNYIKTYEYDSNGNIVKVVYTS